MQVVLKRKCYWCESERTEVRKDNHGNDVLYCLDCGTEMPLS